MTTSTPLFLTLLLLLTPLLHALPFPPPTLRQSTTPPFATLSRRACLSEPALICTLTPTLGNTATGTITLRPIFRRRRCRVRILATIVNLPSRRHAIHIHTYGDLSLADGTSTGGHFSNPQNSPVAHGFSSSAVRHWGDFDNLIANRNGVARYARVDNVIDVRGVVGRGITVHEGEDRGPDFQPTGDAGARIAVCTIGFANPTI